MTNNRKCRGGSNTRGGKRGRHDMETEKANDKKILWNGGGR